MQRCERNSLVFYQFDSFSGEPMLSHGIFTRLGGVSEGHYSALNVGSTVGDNDAHVAENRRRMAGALSVRDDETRTVWQVHGAEVLVIEANSQQESPPVQADGIITKVRGIPLAMRFADCVPVVLYDPIHQAIGMAHAGWKGTLLGAGSATLRAMSAHFDTRAADVIAGIGPSIGPCCYKVGPEVVKGVEDVFGSGDGLVLRPENGGGPHLDLWEANARALRAVGVEQIEVAELCTSCNTHEFYSHRREQGKTGRFGALIMLRQD
jgi:polyphenol oxidase